MEHLKWCQISFQYVHVICLGVLKNGAKYHFCMRKSRGDKYVQGDFLTGLTFSQFSHSMNFNPTPTSLCRHGLFLYEKKYRRYVQDNFLMGPHFFAIFLVLFYFIYLFFGVCREFSCSAHLALRAI